MSNIADIVKGISQAAANAYEGALDEEGNKLQVGLKRDKSIVTVVHGRLARTVLVFPFPVKT